METSIGTRPDAALGMAPLFMSQSGSKGDEVVESSISTRLDAAEELPLLSCPSQGAKEMHAGTVLT